MEMVDSERGLRKSKSQEVGSQEGPGSSVKDIIRVHSDLEEEMASDISVNTWSTEKDEEFYTMNDAEEDACNYLNTAVQLSLNTLFTFSQTNSMKNDDPDTRVYEMFDNHLRAARIVRFASEMVNSELSFLDQDSWELVAHPTSASGRNSSIDASTKSTNELYPMRVSVPLTAIEQSDSPESALKQLRKDIERDRLLINSIRLVGAVVGLEGVISALSDIFDTLLLECKLPLLTTRVKESISQAILIKASRTNSGGIAFSTLQSLIDSDHILLIPQSHAFPPIKIQISLGRFPKDVEILEDEYQIIASPRWGLICQVQCESFYRVRCTDDVMGEKESQKKGIKGEELVNKLISVVYEDFIYFEMKLYGNEIANLGRLIDHQHSNCSSIIITPL